MTQVDPQVLAVALDRVSGNTFEEFVNELQAALVGSDYVPVGGTGDGGADGYVADHLRSDSKRPGHYLQTSVVEKIPAKIRHTVERCRQVGGEGHAVTK